MKTVIQFIHELGDGGASTLVKDYALFLKREGYRVVALMVFPDWNSVNLKIIQDANIETRFVFPNKSFINRLKNKLMAPFFVPRTIKKMVTELQPVALHAHLGVLHLLQPASRNLVFWGVKLVYTCHSEPSVMIGKHGKEYNAASYLLFHNNMQIIALHEDMAKEINGLFGIRNTKVIRNGIDLRRFRNATPNVIELRKNLGIPKDAFVIGHVGRFNKVKNHEFIIRVFERVYLKNDKAFLLLVGTGELEGKIRSWLHERNLDSRSLILTHRQDVHDLMKIMDVFLFPSLWEGLSLVLIEAQASKLKCVISDTISKQSIITNNVTSLGLHDSIDKWVEEVLTTVKTPFKGDFKGWDINDVIKELEDIYG